MPCYGGPDPHEEADRRDLARIANAIVCSINRNDFMVIEAVAHDPESGVTREDIDRWRKVHEEADSRRIAAEAAQREAAAQQVLQLRHQLAVAELNLASLPKPHKER